MEETSLVFLCLTTFTIVFALLGLLAAIMWVVTVMFPERRGRIDASLASAIITTVSTLYPRARVTRIEEKP